MCLEYDIHFIFLPSNSTHLTQPLDVAFFAPLKKAWREILGKWKMGPGRNMPSIPKDKFPRLLNKLLKAILHNSASSIKNDFRKCGIIPVNNEEVLKMLPSQPIQSETQAATERELIDQTFLNVLKAMRYEDTASTKTKKKTKLKVLPGQSVTVDSSESSDSECEDNELCYQSDDCSTSEENDVDCTIKNDLVNSETVVIGQTNHRFEKIEPGNLKTGDWVVVNFVYSSNKAGPSHQIDKKPNIRAFIGQLVSEHPSKNGMFEATFLRKAPSRDFSGFVYRHPDVEDVSSFDRVLS